MSKEEIFALVLVFGAAIGFFVIIYGVLCQMDTKYHENMKYDMLNTNNTTHYNEKIHIDRVHTPQNYLTYGIIALLMMGLISFCIAMKVG